MQLIPHNPQWYLAELVQEVKLDDKQQNIIQVKTVLVRANSAGIAYEKALELGKESENSYENADGTLVTLIFQGLRDLKAVYDATLEHGTELAFEEMIGVTAEQMEQMISPKERLSVFQPVPLAPGRTYIPKDVAVALMQYIEEEWVFGNNRFSNLKS